MLPDLNPGGPKSYGCNLIRYIGYNTIIYGTGYRYIIRTVVALKYFQNSPNCMKCLSFKGTNKRDYKMSGVGKTIPCMLCTRTRYAHIFHCVETGLRPVVAKLLDTKNNYAA
jgi:hypothetical protein